MRYLAFLLALPLFAQVTVTVAGTTNTQGVLTWSHAGTCTVEVSESNTYTPLVHDVDATLFAGSNQSTRAEALFSGNAHIFVVGKRTAELALNGNYYSRALQTNTTQYYRVTCGADVGTGNFTTKNIPFGMTWSDTFQTDPSVTAGTWIAPTLTSDRTQSYVDPRTGALIKPLTQPSDITVAPNTPVGTSGGFNPLCSTVLDSNGYYHCMLSNDYAPYLYAINPTTGASIFLGAMYYFGQAFGLRTGVNGCFNILNGSAWDDVDANTTYCSGFDGTSGDLVLVKMVYTGNDVPVTSGQVGGLPPPAMANVINLTPTPNTLKALITTFVPTLDQTKFSCSVEGYQSGSVAMSCLRGSQDSYGWIGTYNLGNKLPLGSGGTGFVQAMVPMFSNSISRWCTKHTFEYLGQSVTFSFATQSAKGGGTGLGPYQSLLTANVPNAAAGTTTAITVTSTYLPAWGTPPAGYATGEPVSPVDDHFLMTAQVGDIFSTATGEFMQLQTKTDATHWVMLRGVGNVVGFVPTPHSNGDYLQTWCNANTTDPSNLPYMWWKPATDPTAATNYGPNFGSHPVARGTYRDDNSSAFRIGDITNTATWGIYNSTNITISPTFASDIALADGNYMEKHPTIPESAPAWDVDIIPFIGGNLAQIQSDSSTVSLGGDLYKYLYNGGFDTDGLSMKQVANYAVGATTVLREISGPGSVLDGTSAHAYQWCRTNLANECVAGSSPGDIYFNIPAADFPMGSRYCSGNNDAQSAKDICIADMAMIGFATIQTKLMADTTGLAFRVLSKALTAIPHDSNTNNPKTLFDGSWALISTYPPKSVSTAFFLLKIPPLPTSDGVNRTTFVRAALNLTPPGGLGVATARVSFGYTEQGTQQQYFCAGRREACVAVSSTVTDATPFSFQTTDTYSPLACSVSCTITLPVLPMHTAYFHVAYLNGAGMEVASNSGVASESTVTFLGGMNPPPPTTAPTISGNVTISGTAVIQ